MFGNGFNATKLKPQLKMACGRIQIASNKKTALLKQSTREIASMLNEDPPKEEKARIRVEALIRDDHLIEAYEILILNCELLHERIKLITYNKHCPTDLIGVISTIIWASHRVDIEELNLIRKQFVAKYGKAFEENAMKNEHGLLNERVVMKLSIEPPPAYLVQSYLEKICTQYNVDWTPSYRLSAHDMIEPMQPPTGYSIVPSSTGTGYGPSNTSGTPYPTMSNGTTTSSSSSTIPMVTGELMPPVAPTKFTNVTTQEQQQQQDRSMQQQQQPSSPPPTIASATIMEDNEPDIVIPSTTAQTTDENDKSRYTVPPPTSSTYENNIVNNNNSNRKDDHNNNDDDNNDGDATYHQLAARFNQLKK